MKKYAIGLIAAALGASSALAAQAPANYDAALSAASRNGDSGAVAKRKSAAQLRNAPTRKGSVSVSGNAKTTRAGIRSSYDAKLDATTFLWADARTPTAALAPIKSQKLAESAARDYLLKQAGPLNLSKATVSDARVVDVHDIGRGPIIARFRQYHDGVEVFGQNLNVMMGRDMKLVATSGYFAPSSAFEKSTKGAATSARGAFTLSAEQALARAFTDITGQKTSPSLFTGKGQKGDYSLFSIGSQSSEIRAYGTPRAKKVWYYNDGKLTAGWYVEVSGRSVDLVDDYGYSYVVSAVDGAVLFRKNLSEDAAFNYRVFADATGTNQPFDGPLGNATAPYPAPGTQNQSLPRIAATPNLVTLESGPISTGDPWLAPDATTTLGNNVDAYLDLVDGGVRPPGTDPADRVDGFTPNTDDQRGTVNGANTFSYPYAPDANPATATQRQHAATNLFYLNNWLHDWWYDNGFDEASGNAQTDNYGRGGEEGDVLLAEGQDFSGRNNANQRTPADGDSPRQQMYLFDGAVNGELTVAAPVGSVAFNTASFGAQIFDVSGTVVASAPADGCTALTNAGAIAGNIAIINRGTCGFVVKVKNAQDAGATGVIIANNQPGGAPGLGGADATITIGTLSVSQADGATIRAALPTTARLRRSASIDIDGTMDNQIIAHEWFHYTSNRLVGNAAGLSNQQGRGMGEGWADFSAMMLTVRADDRNAPGNANFEGAYPQGVYATRDSYYGIRRAPYSTSFSLFPFTFRHISDGVALPTGVAPFLNFGANSEVHNTGEIWANTLWEIYASLLNDPRYSFAAAQNRMKDYVIAGLKMTPNAPTMLEARDAILAAALATDATDFQLVATAFAKRGMGVGAIAPDRNSATNQSPNAVEDFTAIAGNLSVTDASLDFTYFDGALGFIDNDGVLDPGETALLTVSLVNTGTAPITSDVTANLSSDGDVVFQTTADRTAETPVGGAATGSIVFPASEAAPIPIGGTATGTIEVRLASATGTAQQVTLTLAFPEVGATPTSVFEPASQSIVLDVNYDLSANQRGTDDLEQPQASSVDWGRTLIGQGDNWQIADGDLAPYLFGTGNIWTIPDNGSPSDARLTTPPLLVAPVAVPGVTTAGPITMTFEHYFQFEFAGFAGTTPVGYDGGVIEITSDGGATWQDVVAAGGSFTSGGGYNGLVLALDANGTFTPFGADNPASAFVGDNFGANGGFLEPVTLTLPDSFAGQTIRLRFRMLSDTNTGEFGWSIDNVSFTGLTAAPFSAVVAENGVADNQAPVAVAGADRTIAANRVITLDGTGSTDDVGIVSYQWTQTAGPEVTLNNATSASASFTATETGVYSFSLTVTDEREATGTDSVTLTAIPAPTSNAGADQNVRPFAGVALDGRASTAAPGSTLSYAWTQTSGPTVALAGATTAQPSFTAGEANAIYRFRLRVTDSVSGATSDDSVTVNVTVPGGGSFGFLMLVPGLVAVWLRRRRRIGK